MDRASAIRIIHSGRCPYPGDGRTNQPWPNRFLHRTTLLANESWTDRKGANDRDRGDLLFTIRLCSHSVFAALGTKTLTLPYLRRALDLSWFRPAGERSKSRPVLLSYRWRRSLAKSSPPRPNSPDALHWSRGNARNFVTWLIPYFQALPSRSPLQAWSREAAVAFHGEEGRSEDWLLNFPRGFAYLLPWVLLLPFIRLSKITDPLQRNVAYGLAWGSIIPFVIVLLTPGTLPRYILPLEAPFCWTVGSAVANGASQWSIKGIRVPQGLIFSFVAIGIVAAMIIFPLRSVTYLKRHERIKPIAGEINALLPSEQRLYAIDPDFQPYLFYVRAPITYLTTLGELPADAHYFLIQLRHQRKFESNPRWATLRPKLLAHISSYRNKESLLFAIEH